MCRQAKDAPSRQAVYLHIPGWGGAWQVQILSQDSIMNERGASTVLIVEDETTVRLPLAEYLRDCGYKVLEAGDASEAIDVINSDQVDVVFSDVRMPGRMDGFGLARWMRQNRPEVPVLLTSGWIGSAAAESQAPREVKVIEKPYSQAQVANRLEVLLRNPR
jgi:CheY-like chemotaxis protein